MLLLGAHETHAKVRRFDTVFRYLKLYFTILFYVLLLLLFLANYNLLEKFLIKNLNRFTLYEVILQPRTDYPVNFLLNVDPFLSVTDDPAVNDIRRKISRLVFSSLFIEDVNTKIKPDIIESFNYLQDHVIEFKIRENLYWHDNFSLTVDDVLYTFDLLRALGDKTKYTGALNGNDIRVEKVDNTRFKISLVDQNDNPRPNSSYINFLTFPILPKHILENYSFNNILNLTTTEFGFKPIGSGPFIYYLNKNNELELRKFRAYYDVKRQNNIERYYIRLVSSVEKILHDYKLGYVDLFIQRNTFDEINTSLRDVGLKELKFIKLNSKYVLFFNLSKSAAFNTSALLRRALAKAINRDELISSLQLGYPLMTTVNTSSELFLKSDFLDYNPQFARESILALGYQKQEEFFVKDNKVLELNLRYFDDEYSKLIANRIKQMLYNVGINVNLDGLSLRPKLDSNGLVIVPSFNDVLVNRDFEVLLIPVLHLQEPDVYSEWHSSRASYPGLNFSNFASKAADLYLEESRIKTGNDRVKAVHNFLKIFYQEMPAIYLLHTGFIVFHSKRIGFKEVSQFIPSEYDIYDLIQVLVES